MKNNKKIGILIVAYNAASTLSKVLDRIPPSVYEEIDEIAVFDDASKDDTYLLSIGYKTKYKLEKLTIHLNQRNLGYGGNQKQGFKYFIDKGFDVVVLLHGDGQYAPEILNEMYTPIVNDEADVVLGSRMMNKYGGALRGGMPLYKFIGNKILTFYQNHALKMNLTEFHSGYRAYSLNHLKKIRLDNCSDDFHFDTQIIIKAHHHNLRIKEIPIPTYYGDEICYVNGMKYAKDVFLTTREYKKNLSGKKKSEVYEEFYKPYPLKLYPYSSHYVALMLLNEKENQRILDIGCGDGNFDSHINPNNYVVGVDFVVENDLIRKSIKKYYRADLNNGLPQEIFSEDKFDYILLLDIIEHLVNYNKIIKDAIKLLKDDGKIIISVPNIANIYVRLNLLIGRFPYADKGILDRTHLHFFTLKHLKQLIKKHKLELLKLKVTPIPIIEVLPEFLKRNVGRVLNFLLYYKTLIFKRLLAYQFVVITKKPIEHGKK